MVIPQAKARKSFANPTYTKMVETGKNKSKEHEEKQLKLFHLDFGNEEEEGMDKNSLKYKVRRALRKYFVKKINQKIAMFSRGETLDEDEDVNATSDEV